MFNIEKKLLPAFILVVFGLLFIALAKAPIMMEVERPIVTLINILGFVAASTGIIRIVWYRMKH